MHKLRHPIAVFIVTVLIVIGVGVGVISAIGDTSTIPQNPFARLVAAVNGMGTDLNLAPVSNAANVTVSKEQAIALSLRNNDDSSARVIAAQVVEMKSVHYAEGVLVWVVQLTPSGGADWPTRQPCLGPV